MSAEGSGTSWLPDTTPHSGIHATSATGRRCGTASSTSFYDKQGGPRGDNMTFFSGMFMGMAQRPLGDGTLWPSRHALARSVHGQARLSAAACNRRNGERPTPLIDRQHPHDLFMELAATYSYDSQQKSSVFLYAGLPGEPALGPPAFMHRTSGMDIPEAPITHHWLDFTHITFGVVTAGSSLDTWKLEASAFTRPRTRPASLRYRGAAARQLQARLSWNPIRELSMQVSWGRLHSPEHWRRTRRRRPRHRVRDLHAAFRHRQHLEHDLRLGPKDAAARPDA